VKGKGLLALAIGLLITYSTLVVYAFRNYPHVVEVWTGRFIHEGWATMFERFPVYIPNNPMWVSFLQSEISIFIFIGLFVFIAIAIHKAYPQRW